MNNNQIHPHEGRRFAILLVLFSFLFFTPVSAHSGLTRYVAPTGNDADNNCLAVRNPCATVSHAISQADPGDTIRLSPGVYTETNIWIDKSLTIAGHQATNTLLQGAESMAPVVEPILIIDQGAAVTLQNLTIRHGGPPGGSLTEGAITVGPTSAWPPASLTLVGVAVEANQGNGIGLAHGAVLTLRQSRVNHNQGNGISGYGVRISILENSEIAANSGRGIDFFGDHVVVEWSVIRDNSGSGARSGWGEINVRNSRILGNGGAAVWGDMSCIYVADSVISGNGVGIVGLLYCETIVSDSVIRGNQGSGISVDKSYTHLYNTIIEDNQGDGFSNTDYHYEFTVNDSVIRGNGGYGVNLSYARGSVSNTTISGNQQGGLYIGDEVQLVVDHSSIIRNRSNLNGGGILNHGNLTLVNTVVSQNRAAQHGGGIYSAAVPGSPVIHSLQLIGVTVTQNYADVLRNNAGNGGGIYNQDWSALTLLNTILTDNYDFSPVERHPNCSGGLTSLGGNTFGDLAGCTVIEE